MGTGDQFLSSKGWTITEWNPLGLAIDRGIPEDAFPRENTLLVGANPDRATGLFNLHWLDAANNTCVISGLPLTDGNLEGEVTVNFAGQEVRCHVDISVVDEILDMELVRIMTGTLTLVQSDAGGTDTTAGTFKAQANPEPPPPYDGNEAKLVASSKA